MGRVGARTKATEPRKAVILDALRAGNTRRAAAAYGQVDHATFYRWLQADATFRDDVQKAEGDAEVRAVAIVIRAAQGGTWQAAAWWLERRKPDDYALRNKVDIALDVTREAAKIAEGAGMDAAVVMAEAERILAEGQR